jgi:hypothetical protein
MWPFTHLSSWRQVLLTVCCVAVMGVGGATTVAAPASAPAASARAAPDPQDAAPSASAQDWDSRCTDISGSDLCLMWERGANYEGYLEVWYQKTSGPKRYIHLYVASCDHPKYQVYEGYIEPGQTKAGAWDGYIYPGSCWVGYLRIGNAQWTTGRLYS